MKPLSATVVLSLFTPSFRRSTASSGRTIKYMRYVIVEIIIAKDKLSIFYHMQICRGNF